MNSSKLFWFNIVMTIAFLGFNIIVTYYPKLDDFFWLIPGLIVSSVTIIISLSTATICKNLISEVIFLINIVLLLYYVYPIIYNFF
ncbi:hypothetical protein MT340_009955 [Staphylococcus sp. NRL 16/872]|uniref:type II toxin-antitoxin system antitoxin TsaA n=1 Tax=Staphylococcus sp. NRL 16/872 TaxID=2930131 RepID=UPI001FB2F3E2|nr:MULTISPECIES: hypothetical protein [unclassified Staphylococcus]MCJ1656856.1 hypothetical protein [Staphylococcus sp. NRL 21/187]MCJ1662604.1 hypothetical protein [Staphylococcus sp. NRL 18/288]MCJ1668705.1 hypothetical protein [Staphylococcus sp. NRL 19/737]WEN68922.1 hypothetical protein MT340_009955 [Staphylococcus sp. NRL 16/872]